MNVVVIHSMLNYHASNKDLIPLTNDVEPIIRESGDLEGLALVPAMHLTAAVIVGDEESGLHHGIMEWAEQLAPVNPSYHHHQTGPGQRRCPSQKPFAASPGRPAYHSWQDRLWSRPRLFSCEFDGQRTKRVIVKVIGE